MPVEGSTYKVVPAVCMNGYVCVCVWMYISLHVPQHFINIQ